MAGNRWIRWDVGYYRNAKARALGLQGRALHHASSCWAADNLSDGFIPRQVLALLCAEAEVKQATHKVLVAVGVWIEGADGWTIHDFLEHNKSRAEVEEERAKWKRKKGGQRGVSPGDTEGDSLGDTQGESPGESPPCPPAETDRQTDVRSAVSNCDDDDSVNGAESSSSWIDLALDIAARASYLREPTLCNGNPDRYIAGIRRNLHAEKARDLGELIATGRSPEQAAATLVGSQTHARLAARDITEQRASA